jgi:hypothetical protein
MKHISAHTGKWATDRNNRGLHSGSKKKFFHSINSGPAMGPTQIPVDLVPVFVTRDKISRRDVDPHGKLFLGLGMCFCFITCLHAVDKQFLPL